MTMENYKSWDIDVNEFFNLSSREDKIGFLIKLGTLAPSSHNSQPWSFKMDNNEITVMADRSRELPVSDANFRQMFISLGCAIENIALAADYYGLKPRIEYDEGGINNLRAAKIFLDFDSNDRKNDNNHPIFTITKRSTNRNKYKSEMPTENFLGLIKSLVSQDVRLDIVSNQDKKKTIAEAVVNGIGEAMSDPNFRKELSGYVKANNTKDFLGMPGSGLGMPFIVSLIVPFVLKILNVSRLSRKQDLELLINHTPVFGIISTEKDDKQSWVKAGRAYQRIALEAERQGLKTAVLAGAIQIGDYHKDLQKALGITNRPQVFFRVGYCDLVSGHSPRLPVNRTIIK